MRRCFELAVNGLGNVAPNPLVGCVIVNEGKIIGEGFHQYYGGAHAEVNAIHAVKNKEALKSSTLYVNMEPCAHRGKTPPCTDLITSHGIPEVLIACMDTHEVSGDGVSILKESGCKIIAGVLEEEAKTLNQRFLTFHEKKRPYIILKWAQSADGFIDGIRNNGKPVQISGKLSKYLAHKWRSEEQAIMVGTKTALADNPRLNVREWRGNNPLRIVLDKSLKLPSHLHLFDGSQSTIVFTSKQKEPEEHLEYIVIDFEQDVLSQVMKTLCEREIQSLIVEGGSILLNSFLDKGLWDEAKVFNSNMMLGKGVKAPALPAVEYSRTDVDDDQLFIFLNR